MEYYSRIVDNTPGKPETVARVARISEIVAATLVKAAEDARSFFADGRPFSANLFADLVRYYAQQNFRTEQLETEDDDDFSVEAHALANIGLQLFSDGFLFKILKFGPNQTVPIPQTLTRIDFYNQQLSAIPDRSNVLRQVELNLIYLWDCDNDHKVIRLLLLCPKSGGRTAGSVAWHWDEEIRLPAITPEQEPEGEDRGDLEITEQPAASEEIGDDFPAHSEAPDEDDTSQGDSKLDSN